ncbi:MAG TPA: universal stress protein, partial [Pilimelia sp.]|nr:universal stress protein [Pilimelia sp.]
MESFAALGLAATEASLRQAPLLVTHVWAGPHWRPVRTGGEPTSRADAERLLAAATGWLRRHHPRVQVCGQLPLGEPAEVLAGESGTADLVVVGHRGTGHAAGGWGSVAARLSDTCDAPLLVRVFRPRAGEPPTGAPVVVAVPAAAPSPSLIGFAFEEAARHGAPLAACHVWPAAPLPADAQARRAGTAA